MSDPIPKLTYGTVIIGSSPAMLLEAILRTQAGNGPTLVIEANSQLGGSWTPQTRFGHQIDNGPHLFYNFNTDLSAMFDTLSSITGCPFEQMVPAPRSESRLNPAIMEFSFGMRGSLKRKLLRAARAAFARNWLPWFKPFKYRRPKGGLSNIVAQFSERIVSLGVEVRLMATAETLKELPDGIVEVTLDTGEVITARVVKASAACLPTLGLVSLDKTLPDLKWRTYGQAYLYLRKARQNVFSFFRCFYDKNFFLAADLSNSAQPPLPEDCTIISVNLQSKVEAAQVSAADIYNFLERNDLIEGLCGKPEIIQLEWEIIKVPIITKDMIDLINVDLNSIEFIHCNNLVRTLYSRLEVAHVL